MLKRVHFLFHVQRKGVPQEKDEYNEQGREGKESKLGDNADAVAATGEEQKSFEHHDAILDWKAPEQSLDEDDDDLQNHGLGYLYSALANISLYLELNFLLR